MPQAARLLRSWVRIPPGARILWLWKQSFEIRSYEISSVVWLHVYPILNGVCVQCAVHSETLIESLTVHRLRLRPVWVRNTRTVSWRNIDCWSSYRANIHIVRMWNCLNSRKYCPKEIPLLLWKLLWKSWHPNIVHFFKKSVPPLPLSLPVSLSTFLTFLYPIL